ncbi:MAG: universal stress protein [Acidobacteria bacterium]|nr:universal stress protein [Acidobacteriota bacterium]
MKKAPRKILVGLKQAADAEELIGLAVHVAATEARIQALYVNEIPPALPLDARDETLDAPERAVAKAVERLARRFKRRKLSLRILRARHAGKTIVEELKQGKFDLAVIGYHHKRSLQELLLGTTAQYLAKHTPCGLLMSIPPRR